MDALLDPVNRTRGGVKWGLVAHAVAMFSVMTVLTGMNLDLQSTSYVENREFPSTRDVPFLGPLGYRLSIYSKPINVVPYTMFFLNGLLSDGLLVCAKLSRPDAQRRLLI